MNARRTSVVFTIRSTCAPGIDFSAYALCREETLHSTVLITAGASNVWSRRCVTPSSRRCETSGSDQTLFSTRKTSHRIARAVAETLS